MNTQKVWHDLYLANEVLFYADAMEGMRIAWNIDVGLGMLRSMTLPSASMHTLLYQTRFGVELFL